MPTYSATMVLVVTAHLPSEREFRRHCARWVRRGGVNVKRWELDQVAVVPDVQAGKLLLHLCTVGNPDFGQYAPVTEPEWHVVASLAEARDKCCQYFEKYAGRIGSGNWSPTSGLVTDSKGALVARFSYNQRCWSPAGEELTCLDVGTPTSSAEPVKYVVLGPDGVPIREKPFASKVDAERGVAEFVNRFRLQGYYAGAGYRLELDEIVARCRVEELDGNGTASK